MSGLRLFLLGSPRLERDGVSLELRRRKAMGILTYLTIRDQPHRRETLATLFWPDYDHSSARADLRRMLSVLNRVLGKGVLAADRESVRLNREVDLWLDVHHFHRLLADRETHSHPKDEVCSNCLTLLTEAVALYRDDFLTGFTLPDCPEFDEWQFFQTESLRQELALAQERLVRGHSIQGEFETAIPHARRWLALDRLHEPAQRKMMQLYAWAGQSAAALRQYDECVRVLDEELGVPPEAATTELYTTIKAKRIPPPPSQTEKHHITDTPSPLPPSPSAPPHNLPPQLTPFIGREEELAKITDLIQDEPACRLVTLIGPGGIGKTRLSLQAAADSINAFKHGVFFVPLAPLSTAESVLPTIADALNFPLSGSNPKEQLLNYLSEKEMLLVLDNFEHLIPLGVTDLLSEMLIRAPQLKLLVTSRERLNLQEEWGVEVSGLRFPTGTEIEETSLEAYEGIQLFIQRAQRARPGFTLSAENSPHIVRICQLVEGMPLGLELAATWVRMMTCQEIVQEIDRGLDFLTTSLRDLPERHQSLRAVFEQSWQLLSAEERVVFRKLSIFRGGFRRRAAERVAGASLPLLSALVDKSLLRRTRTGRYEIHELLRQYAAERLNHLPDEMEEAQDRHADYYLTFLQQQTDDLKGKNEPRAIEVITEEIDNVRAGWSWAITQRNTMTLGRAADSLELFYDLRGWFPEGEAAFREAVKSLTEDQERVIEHLSESRQGSKGAGEQGSRGGIESEQPKQGEQKTQSKIQNLEDTRMGAKSKIVLAQLLRGQGWFSTQLGFLEWGQELLQQSVSLLRQTERSSQLAFSLHRLADPYLLQGYYRETKQVARESLTLYTEVGDRWGSGWSLWLLGVVAIYQGAYAEANQLFEESVRVLRQLGTKGHKGLAFSISMLATAALTRGEYAPAERFFEEALRMGRDLDNLQGRGYILRNMGYLAIALGNYPQAQEWMEKSLKIFQEIGARSASVFPLSELGSVARLRGEYQRAEQFHQESLAIAREIGERRGIALGLHNLGRLAYDMDNYPRAEQYLQESLTRYKELGNQPGVASALCRLGYVACAMGSSRYQEANEYLNQALEIAAKIGAPPLILDILVGLATLLVAGKPEDAERERAVQLLALALHHPASEQETKDKANRLLAELASKLPPEVMAAAQERGKARELDMIVAEIMERN